MTSWIFDGQQKLFTNANKYIILKTYTKLSVTTNLDHCVIQMKDKSNTGHDTLQKPSKILRVVTKNI